MPAYKLMLLLIGIVMLTATCNSNRYKYRIRYQSKGCKSGRAIYATSAYREYKKAHAQLFDSVAKDRVKECLCGKYRRYFKRNKYSRSVIEPLYINMQNCTGVYATRYFHYNNPLYANGHPHYVFLIDGKKYRRVPEDTLKLKKILFSANSNFAKIYSKSELEVIYQDIKYGRIWTKYASILSPCSIKDKGKIIYNSHKK